MANQSKGFTLVELIMVLVLTSILGALAATRFNATTATAPYQADQLARNIRHMQILAMSWGQSLRLTAAGTSYNVACVNAGAAPCNVSPVIDPATGAPFTVTLSSNVTIAGAATDINSLGTPVAAAVALTTNRSFTLTANAEMWTVTIRPITGFVTVTTP